MSADTFSDGIIMVERLSNLNRARTLGVLQGGQTIEAVANQFNGLNCHFLICFTLLGYHFVILLSPKAFVNCLLSFVHCYCRANHWSFTGK